MITIDEYKNIFLDEIRTEAEVSSTDSEYVFLTNTLEILSQNGNFSEPIEHFFEKSYRRGNKNIHMKFNAYAYDTSDNSWAFIISDFVDDYNPGNITYQDILSLRDKVMNFIEETYSGEIFRYIEDADETYSLAEKMKKDLNQEVLVSSILKIKIYILTNKMMSTRIKELPQDNFYDRPVEVTLWDFQKFYEVFSMGNNEEIEISFKDHGYFGIPCLLADLSSESDYTAYLSIIPGDLLAKIFIKYGSRLLEGNIRAFLSIKGQVNKGIRNTIISEPMRFFTYNNGIAATSSEVEIKRKDDQLYITGMRNLQIINGGQTTASLASAVIRKENLHLDNIFVPMKITILNKATYVDDESKYNTLISKIAKYANSQNKVSDADFFANSQFHVVMEKLSKKIVAPQKPGKLNSTYWYYERARGKYLQEQFKMTKAEREKWEKKYPKDQLITKEKLAKYVNAFEGYPHIVSKGSANNMKQFAERIEKEIVNQNNGINEEFFRQCVVKSIIFIEVDRLVAKQPWYQKGGYKLNIVPYTIAKIIDCIPSSWSIDFNRIWNNQCLYPSFIKEIENVAKITNDFILQSGGVIVTEYCKQEKTWLKYKSFKYQLSNEFVQDLVPTETILVALDNAIKEKKQDNQIGLEIEVVNYGAEKWKLLLEKALKYKILAPSEIALLNLAASIGQPKGKIPNAFEARQLIKIRKKLEENGIQV